VRRSTGARAAKSLSFPSSCVFGVCRVREGKELWLNDKLNKTKDQTIPNEMDEDNRPALLPCSSSDLERVAGTRLGTVESVVTLWASVV
jgi:hypothetical protein